eukprot:CAMPEP_0185798808 /NCGR_PEP_ID=MMETSP1174-20130828/162344_1 /TAXON_ID=35687 /ORGANISM="Dictyocha speculum, Strain CCMP1381" /LENGTH=276 /DNA_ID=CAMNT_0028494327 /DNA_START=339 /DNA_END=1166 /DNA_ORIENTATION=+
MVASSSSHLKDTKVSISSSSSSSSTSVPPHWPQSRRRSHPREENGPLEQTTNLPHGWIYVVEHALLREDYPTESSSSSSSQVAPPLTAMMASEWRVIHRSAKLIAVATGLERGRVHAFRSKIEARSSKDVSERCGSAYGQILTCIAPLGSKTYSFTVDATDAGSDKNKLNRETLRSGTIKDGEAVMHQASAALIEEKMMMPKRSQRSSEDSAVEEFLHEIDGLVYDDEDVAEDGDDSLCWDELWDQERQRPYYQHRSSGHVQWRRPEEWHRKALIW